MPHHGKDIIIVSDQEVHDQEVTQLDCHARIIGKNFYECLVAGGGTRA